MVLVAAGLVAERNTACFQKHLPIAFLSFLDGLEPIQTLRKHRISAYFQFRAVLVAHLGCPPWSLAGALAPSCTLQRRCRWLCSAPSCSGTYVRAAQAAPTPRSKQTGGTLLQGAASCIPLGAPAQALPFPRHPKGLGRSPHWPRHPLFLEHGLETGVVDNKGFFTVHSAMGRRPPLCFTVHSVMGRRPTLSTQ